MRPRVASRPSRMILAILSSSAGTPPAASSSRILLLPYVSSLVSKAVHSHPPKLGARIFPQKLDRALEYRLTQLEFLGQTLV